MRAIQAVCAVGIVWCMSGAYAITITEPGDSDMFWQHYSLVYASIHEASSTVEDVRRLTVNPLATVSGSFDCTAVGEAMEIAVHMGGSLSHATMPRKGSKVLLLVVDRGESLRSKEGGRSKREYVIPSESLFPFMPDERAIVEVTGLDDPAVASIQSNIRALRERYEKEGSPLDNLERPESPPGQTREEAVREFEASRKAELERRAEGLRQLILKGPPSGSPPALESADIATSDSMGTTSSASSVPAED